MYVSSYCYLQHPPRLGGKEAKRHPLRPASQGRAGQPPAAKSPSVSTPFQGGTVTYSFSFTIYVAIQVFPAPYLSLSCVALAMNPCEANNREGEEKEWDEKE